MSRTPSSFTCTVTPFAADGALDTAAWREHVDRIVSTGMGVYVGSGSPGEGFALDLAETETLYGTAAEVASGRAPARAMGIESRTAADYIELVRIAESAGLDAIQIYCVDAGHANTPTPAELEHYFRTILDATTIACTLSSHVFSGYVIPPDVVERLLADYPDRILGLTVTNPDIRYLVRIIEVADGRCDVHVGGAMQALSVLALGGQGFLCTEGNIIPRTCTTIIDGHVRGDMGAAQSAYRDVIALFAANRWQGGSMRYLKAIMRVVGWSGHHLRPPFLPLGDDEVEAVAAQLADLGIDELHALLPTP